MTSLRRPAVLTLILCSLAAPALAGPYQGGPPANHPGLPLDPELLPPNSRPGDCVVRRVTGPRGAYRWDRVECDSDSGWSDYDRWGYGRGRLDVETREGPPPLLGGPPPEAYRYDNAYEGAYGNAYAGDRYGERRHDSFRERRVEGYEREHVCACGDRYGGAYRDASYPPAYGYGYLAAGRDEAGYLIWPGKTP